MSDYDRKKVDRAHTVAIFALLGFFIPVLGIFLSILAIGINSGVQPKTPEIKKRKWHVEIIALLAISLSVLAGLGWYLAYDEYNKKIQDEQQTIQQAEQNLEQVQITEEEVRQENLEICLDDVNKWYQENAQGNHPYEYWNQLNTMRQQEMDECELRYGD